MKAGEVRVTHGIPRRELSLRDVVVEGDGLARVVRADRVNVARVDEAERSGLWEVGAIGCKVVI